MNLNHWKQKPCPKYDCRKESCKCGLKKVIIPAALGDDSEGSSVAPKNGAYCNAIVIYEVNDHVYIYSTEGIPTLINVEGGSSEEAIEELTKKLNQEILDRGAADDVLQQEIDDLKNSPDVVDIVATYAALQAYDTSKLGDNDIIRVLADETHDGQSTYYRWNKQSSTWTYIGVVGDYYTKGQVDTLLADKQDELTAGANISIAQVDNDLVISATDTTYTAGANISISDENVNSATDTTYSNFTGTDGNTGGTSGLVPAPATTDAGKFLKADGTWDTAGGGGDTVYSDKTTSNSSTGGAVYIGNLDSSQTEQADPTATDNHYRYFWALPDSNSRIPKDGTICILGNNEQEQGMAIGYGTNTYSSSNYYGLAVGYGASVYRSSGVAIGFNSSSQAENSICIGRQSRNSHQNYKNSVALGSFSDNTRAGELNIGTGGSNNGYNNTDYRVIGGVHDGQELHDAATVAQGNTLATTAPTTSTVGVLGQLWTDTTNMHTYQCTAISGSTYTWQMRW